MKKMGKGVIVIVIGILLVVLVACNAGCAIIGSMFTGETAMASDYEQYQQKIVAIAKDIMAGKPEPGWHEKDDPNQKYLIPYVWGGGHSGTPGPSTGTCGDGYEGPQPCVDDSTIGLDCSGYVRWVYDLAFNSDVLNGGSNDQIGMVQPVSKDQAQPGDLVFFGSDPKHTHHVGIYLGNDTMINEYSHPNQSVTTNPISGEPDLVGYYHYTPPTSVLQQYHDSQPGGPGNVPDPGSNCSGACAAKLITEVFGPDAADALTVAKCESSLNPRAVNPTSQPGGPPEGLFQIVYPGTWNGTKEANQDPFNARANTLAAYEIVQRDHGWGEWQCAQENHIRPYN